jgi:hypothetical protein
MDLPELVHFKIIKYIENIKDKIKYINSISNNFNEYDYYIKILENNNDWQYIKFMYDTGVLCKLVYKNHNISKIYLNINNEIIKKVDFIYDFQFNISNYIFDDLITEIIDNKEIINRIPTSFIDANYLCNYYEELMMDIEIYTDNLLEYDNYSDNEISVLDDEFYELYLKEEYRKYFIEGFNSVDDTVNDTVNDDNNLFVDELIKKCKN